MRVCTQPCLSLPLLMANEPQSNHLYSMKLIPLKPHDRFKQPIFYDFQHTNPKKQEIVIDLPQMNFLSEPGVPAFMAPIDKYFVLKNPNHFKENFERRVDRGKEEELKHLLLPKPPRKSRYCGICAQFYEDYYSHVVSESHKTKFGNHPFLPKLYKEMKKIHTGFMREQWKYIQDAVQSPDDISMEKFDDRRGLFSSDKKLRSKSCDPGEAGGHYVSELSRKDMQDDSSKENVDLKTTKKEVYQAKKITKKKNSMKTSKVQPHFLEGAEPNGFANDAEAAISNNNRQYHLDITHNPEEAENLGKIGGNSGMSSASKPPKRVFYRLQVGNNTPESLRNKPVPLNLSKFGYHNKEPRSPRYNSIIPLKREELNTEPNLNLLRVEDDQEEIKFKRRNPQKNLKRDFYKLSENEENEEEKDLVHFMKKVKLTDSQSVKGDDEQIKIDLTTSQNRKWQSLKDSFVGFLGELKGTVNKLYDLWKKKDP